MAPVGGMPIGDALGAEHLLSGPPQPRKPGFFGRRRANAVAEDLTLESAKQALCRLIGIERARLHLGPSLPSAPATTLPVALALALGVRHAPSLAARLVQTLPAAATMDEIIARHALVAPSLPHLEPELADACKACSPMTRLVAFPAPNEEADTLDLAERFLAMPAMRQWLIAALAVPVPAVSVAVRAWRARLLNIWRSKGDDGIERALDVYETALSVHRRGHEEQIARAALSLRNDASRAGDEAMADALSVAAWWRPLSAIRRSAPDRLRTRQALDISVYLAAVRLADIVRPLQ